MCVILLQGSSFGFTKCDITRTVLSESPHLQSTPPKKYPFHLKTYLGGGHSHLLVDIKCLSIDPPFHADLTPNDPLFPLSYQILHTNWKYLGALCAFWEIYTFCSNFKIKFANFGLKIAVLHTKWPPFLGIHIKKILFVFAFYFIFFLELPQNDPFFSEILYRMPLTFVLQSALIRHFHIRVPPPWKTEHHFFLNNSFQVARVKFWVFQICVCVGGGGL